MHESPIPRSTLAYFVVASVVATLLCFWCVQKHPYGYYQLLRWVVLAVGVWGAMVSYELFHHRPLLQWMPWAYAAMGILFNPIVPFRLKRATWEVVDVATGIWLISAAIGVVTMLRKQGDNER